MKPRESAGEAGIASKLENPSAVQAGASKSRHDGLGGDSAIESGSSLKPYLQALYQEQTPAGSSWKCRSTEEDQAPSGKLSQGFCFEWRLSIRRRGVFW